MTGCLFEGEGLKAYAPWISLHRQRIHWLLPTNHPTHQPTNPPTAQVLPNDTSVADTALFLSRAFAAAWDASIACWKVKYTQLQWRPISAFQQGYPADGSVKAFEAQPTWTPLINTPAHPECE